MFSKKLITAALAIAAAGAFAGSAQASVIDYDDVKLTSSDYDFGGDGYAFGEPTSPGEIHFHHESGGIRPHLAGAIHLNNAEDTCGRMRMEYYNAAGTWLATRYGGEVCVFDDQHDVWSVDLDTYTDPAIYSVRVSVQKETASGWSTTVSETYAANTHSDKVRMTEQSVDFGDEYWNTWGYPLGSGSVSWGLSESQVTPRLTGELWISNAAGLCARMNIRYLTETGVFLTERAGGTECLATGSYDAWTVDLAPYSSNKIGQVQVQLQTLASNGTYLTAASQTVSINE